MLSYPICTVIMKVYSTSLSRLYQGSHSTVVACWTAGQHLEQSILHLGHDSYQNLSDQPWLSLAQYSPTVQNRGLKHFISFSLESLWIVSLDRVPGSVFVRHYLFAASARGVKSPGRRFSAVLPVNTVRQRLIASDFLCCAASVARCVLHGIKLGTERLKAVAKFWV